MLLARVHLGLSALALFAVEAGAAVTVYTTVEQDRRYSVQWSTEACECAHAQASAVMPDPQDPLA